jgi:37-kD nucleoid-associated bacterial protein
MLDFSHCVIQQAAVHIIGNPGNEEGLTLSNGSLDLTNKELHDSMKSYFLSGFVAPEFFAFTFPSDDPDLNPVYQFANAVFRNAELFFANSVDLAGYLQEAILLANGKGGDFYVVLFAGLVVDGEPSDALGIFKSESKESYLQLHRSSGKYTPKIARGTNLQRLDKGCLILNSDAEEGFCVCIIDQGSGSEANFWKNDFLKVRGWHDSYHYTQNFMNLTRAYLVDQLHEEFDVSKADQIDLLNRSVDFFKSRDQFQKGQFEAEVLGDTDFIASFRKFSEGYRDQSDLNILDNFEISAPAVKRQARIFKSVLKLDKNFHVYIHGNRQLIQKGFDEVIGKHYYKIYFDKES